MDAFPDLLDPMSARIIAWADRDLGLKHSSYELVIWLLTQPGYCWVGTLQKMVDAPAQPPYRRVSIRTCKRSLKALAEIGAVSVEKKGRTHIVRLIVPDHLGERPFRRALDFGDEDG